MSGPTEVLETHAELTEGQPHDIRLLTIEKTLTQESGSGYFSPTLASNLTHFICKSGFNSEFWQQSGDRSN